MPTIHILGDSIASRPRSLLLRYGAAVVCAVLAVAVESALRVSGTGITSVFLAAVMVSTWFGGLGPGLLTTVLSSLLIAILFMEPAGSIRVEREDALRIGLFLITSILIGWLHHLNRQTHERLTEANRSKERFLAMLGHELRNPLNPVLSLASAQAEDSSLPPSVRQDAAMVCRNIEVEVRLIDDLLDANRLRAGKLSLKFAPVSLRQILQDVVAMCRDDIATKSISLELACGSEDTYVHGDAVRLRQVIWNLLRNATKFTPTGGRIIIDCSCPDAHTVKLTVKDNGIGIPPEVLPNVFAPFEQSSQLAVRQAGGLGLGLAIARMLVEGHGGTIQAFSQGEGRGATFAVSLPRLVAPPSTRTCAATATQPPPVPPRETKPLRILIVEDQPDSARVMRRLLEREGHRAEIAGTLSSAQEALAAEPFDLVISDLGLPDGSGIDLIRHIRLQGQTTPAISLSGYGGELDVAASLDAGFGQHLVKPVTVAQLRQAIASATNGRPLPAH